MGAWENRSSLKVDGCQSLGFKLVAHGWLSSSVEETEALQDRVYSKHGGCIRTSSVALQARLNGWVLPVALSFDRKLVSGCCKAWLQAVGANQKFTKLGFIRFHRSGLRLHAVQEKDDLAKWAPW